MAPPPPTGLPVPATRDGTATPGTERMLPAAWVLRELARKDARIAALEARIAELERAPAVVTTMAPEAWGIDSARLTLTEYRLLCGLLPLADEAAPGGYRPRIVSAEALLRLVWPEALKADGAATDDLRPLVRVNLARARAKLRGGGWVLPFSNNRGEYTLHREGDLPPPGYRSKATNSFRTRVTVEQARAALEAWRRTGSRHEATVASGISRTTVNELTRGRHWTQKEGLLPVLGDGNG